MNKTCVLSFRGADQKIVGGVIGATYWGWFYINLMWVKDEFRGRGHGHRLLKWAEDEARGRGAKHVYLDTFSFQAPAFYKKQWLSGFWRIKRFSSRASALLFDKRSLGKGCRDEISGRILPYSVRGHLARRWGDWFDGFQITYQW